MQLSSHLTKKAESRSFSPITGRSLDSYVFPKILKRLFDINYSPTWKKNIDLLLAADSGKCSVVLLLTATINAVNHPILIHRLNEWAEVSVSALNWLSYLTKISFSVTISNSFSSSASIPCYNNMVPVYQVYFCHCYYLC